MKKIISALLLFLCSISYAQSKDQTDIGREGTLFFKDKTEQKGFIKLDKKNHIWFRKTKDDDEVLYNYNEVIRFNAITNLGTFRDYHYELVPMGSKTKVILVDDANETGTLYFKNKTQKKGIIKFVEKSRLEFKEHENAEKQIYNFDEVYKINYNHSDGNIYDFEYKLVVIENKTKIILLKSEISDSKLNLLTLAKERAGFGIPVGYFLPIASGINFSITANIPLSQGGEYFEYYLSRENDLYATKITRSNINNSHFRNTVAPEFFSDCEDIVEKIKSKYFDKYDAIGLVNYYNTNCKK
jgi:hypothetical protein